MGLHHRSVKQISGTWKALCKPSSGTAGKIKDIGNTVSDATPPGIPTFAGGRPTLALTTLPLAAGAAQPPAAPPPPGAHPPGGLAGTPPVATGWLDAVVGLFATESDPTDPLAWLTNMGGEPAGQLMRASRRGSCPSAARPPAAALPA